MERLSPEILSHIFSYLRAEDLMAVQDVSRLWNKESQSSRVWRRMSYSPSWDVRRDDVEKFLRRAPKLQSFLPENGIDRTLSKMLVKCCPHLRKLSLNVQELRKEEIAELLGHYHGIEDLQLVVFVFWGDSPPVVFETIFNCCPTLKRLDLLSLSGLAISFDADFIPFEKATHLTNLKLPVSDVNCEKIFDGISSCTNLECLTLRFDNVTLDDIWDFLPGVPKLNRLSLLYVNSMALSSLFEKDVSKLQYLKLHGFGFSCDLEPMFTKCLSLKTLVFSCYSLCDDQFKCIKELPQLEYLTFDCCFDLTDKVVEYICECPNLRALELIQCGTLTDQTPIIVMNSKKLSRFIFEEYEDD